MPATGSSLLEGIVVGEDLPHSGARKPTLRIWLTALVLGIAALVVFLWRIGAPNYPFYDESQYVDAARAFLAHTGNTNPEAPPLGKLLLAMGIEVFGDNPLGWRAMGAISGALSLMGVFLWVYLLLRDYAMALTAALLTFFDNFLYVMSRVAMMDIFLVGFLIWALCAFTAAVVIDSLRAFQRRMLLALAGFLFGLACACKWNGVDTLAAAILISAVIVALPQRLRDEHIARFRRNLLQPGIVPLALCLLVIPLLAYGAAFWPLCRSLHLPFSIEQIVAMNAFIWRFHKAVPGNPAIAVPWYAWAFQVAPQRALSYLVGNWAIMWSGLIALAYCIRRIKSLPEMLIVCLYVANILQWAVTPQRLLYYYYYFPNAIFLGVAIVIALHCLPTRIFGIRLNVLCLVISGCVFLYCYPHMAHLEAPFDCALGCWP